MGGTFIIVIFRSFKKTEEVNQNSLIGVACIFIAMVAFSCYLIIMKIFVFKKPTLPNKSVEQIKPPFQNEGTTTITIQENDMNQNKKQVKSQENEDEKPYPSLHLVLWIMCYATIFNCLISIILYTFFDKKIFNLTLDSFFPIVFSAIFGKFSNN